MPTTDYVDFEYGTHPLPAIAAGKTGEPETITDDAALSLATEPSNIAITQATNRALTLADGDETQRKFVYMTVKSGAGNAVLTPANLTGGTTITFDAVGEYAELRFVAGSWAVIATTATVA